VYVYNTVHVGWVVWFPPGRYYSDSGATILKRESNDMTVRDVLEHTLRKRCLRFGPEYFLESKNAPGRALDPVTMLSELEGGDSTKALEFRLIRKHSRIMMLELCRWNYVANSECC